MAEMDITLKYINDVISRSLCQKDNTDESSSSDCLVDLLSTTIKKQSSYLKKYFVAPSEVESMENQNMEVKKHRLEGDEATKATDVKSRKKDNSARYIVEDIPDVIESSQKVKKRKKHPMEIDKNPDEIESSFWSIPETKVKFYSPISGDVDIENVNKKKKHKECLRTEELELYKSLSLNKPEDCVQKVKKHKKDKYLYQSLLVKNNEEQEKQKTETSECSEPEFGKKRKKKKRHRDNEEPLIHVEVEDQKMEVNTHPLTEDIVDYSLANEDRATSKSRKKKKKRHRDNEDLQINDEVTSLKMEVDTFPLTEDIAEPSLANEDGTLSKSRKKKKKRHRDVEEAKIDIKIEPQTFFPLSENIEETSSANEDISSVRKKKKKKKYQDEGCKGEHQNPKSNLELYDSLNNPSADELEESLISFGQVDMKQKKPKKGKPGDEETQTENKPRKIKLKHEIVQKTLPTSCKTITEESSSKLELPQEIATLIKKYAPNSESESETNDEIPAIKKKKRKNVEPKIHESLPADLSINEYVNDIVQQSKTSLSNEDILLMKNLRVVIPWVIPLSHSIETSLTHPSKAQQDMFKELKDIKMKNSMYSKEEDDKIRQNWETFCQEHDLTPNPTLFFPKDKKEQFLSREEKLHFVRYLGKGLEDRTLCSIYKRFQILFTKCKKGKFNTTEDMIISRFMEESKDPNKFKLLGDVLGRNRVLVKKRWLVLKEGNDDKIEWTMNSMGKLVEEILKVMKKSTVDELKCVKIPTEHWKMLEESLQIPVRKLRHKWYTFIYPSLFNEESQDLNKIRKKLLHVLDQKQLTDRKQINWNEVAKEFNGISGKKLYLIFTVMLDKHIPTEFHHNLPECISKLKNLKWIGLPKKFKKLGYGDGKLFYET